MAHNGIAIKLSKLTKDYRLYQKPVHRILETFLPGNDSYYKPFRALDNVSIEVCKGESIGIVGKNGSGKSTLLQIICGIVKPSSGDIEVNGKISALLELGAGFNPEFSGRQNVYLNGSILGLSQDEIDDRFTDILAFADIGDFIDQPVKSYSSGMFVRLAFAVAVSVEPEILVVDEALSVGDEAFQRKCFAHINLIQEKGGTILFVTHSAASVIELCSRAILLDQGELLLSGSPKKVISRYHKLIYAPENKADQVREDFRNLPGRFDLSEDELEPEPIGLQFTEKSPILDSAGGSAYNPYLVPASTVKYESRGASISDPVILSIAGERVNILQSGEQYFYEYQAKFNIDAEKIKFGMLIKTIKGVEISGYSAPSDEIGIKNIKAGDAILVKFPFTCSFNPGVYFLNAGLLKTGGEEEYLDRQLDVAMFRVEEKSDSNSTGIVSMVGPPVYKWL